MKPTMKRPCPPETPQNAIESVLFGDRVAVVDRSVAPDGLIISQSRRIEEQETNEQAMNQSAKIPAWTDDDIVEWASGPAVKVSFEGYWQDRCRSLGVEWDRYDLASLTAAAVEFKDRNKGNRAAFNEWWLNKNHVPSPPEMKRQATQLSWGPQIRNGNFVFGAGIGGANQVREMALLSGSPFSCLLVSHTIASFINPSSRPNCIPLLPLRGLQIELLISLEAAVPRFTILGTRMMRSVLGPTWICRACFLRGYRTIKSAMPISLDSSSSTVMKRIALFCRPILGSPDAIRS